MLFKDIQNEYGEFLESFNITQYYLIDLIRDTKNFLEAYKKIKNFDVEFVQNLEWNMIYFQYFLDKTDEFIETIENHISIAEMKFPESKAKNIF